MTLDEVVDIMMGKDGNYGIRRQGWPKGKATLIMDAACAHFVQRNSGKRYSMPLADSLATDWKRVKVKHLVPKLATTFDDFYERVFVSIQRSNNP